MKLATSIRALCLLAMSLSGCLMDSPAAELKRGPYLQTPTSDSIIVRWRTDAACESVVSYGTEVDVLAMSVTNENATTEHEVRLSGLVASTTYFYSIGSGGETLVVGPEYRFTTSPVKGEAKPTRVWVLGDPGQCADDAQVRVRDAYYQFAGPRETDVWLTLGDNAYLYNTDDEYQTAFFDVYSTMFRRTPIWSAIGNHETWPLYLGKPIPYFDIFSFPTNGEAGGVASGTEHYYSFDYGNIHFVCLDSMMVSRATNSPMADWLRADLAANTSTWTIAFFHHPPYSKGTHDSDWEIELIEMRQNFVPILEEYGVDLVLNGHSHKYERTYQLRGHLGFSTTLKPDMVLDQGSGRERDTGSYIKPTSGPWANEGSVYVEVGCSGSTDEPSGHHPAMFFDEVQKGSLILDIGGDRLDGKFLRDTGAIDDYFTVQKGAPDPLRVCSLTIKGGKLTLRWKSIRGESYRVEHTESGSTQDWQSASDPITATGSTTSWTNALTPGSMYLYRVVRIPPPPPPPDQAAYRKLSSGLSLVVALQGWCRPLLPCPEQQKDAPPGAWLGEGIVSNTADWKRKSKPHFGAFSLVSRSATARAQVPDALAPALMKSHHRLLS